MVARMVELRKGKMTEEECRAALKKSNYFGTMLVAMGKADALLGGATYSTADTVRPDPAAGQDQAGATPSSPPASFWCAPPPPATTTCWPWPTAPSTSSPTRTSWWRSPPRPSPAPRSSASTPKVAFLSYSTFGSGKGEDVDKMRNAAEKAKLAMPNVPIEGEPAV